MKERAFLIIKGNSAEEVEQYVKDRFTRSTEFPLEWADWSIQGETPEPLQDGTQWSMVIKFPPDNILDVGARLGKWYTDPDLDCLDDFGYPAGTLLYYAPYDRED